MQDCKDQKLGDIVSPWKKFQFCEIFYNTAEINLSIIQFIVQTGIQSPGRGGGGVLDISLGRDKIR